MRLYSDVYCTWLAVASCGQLWPVGATSSCFIGNCTSLPKLLWLRQPTRGVCHLAIFREDGHPGKPFRCSEDMLSDLKSRICRIINIIAQSRCMKAIQSQHLRRFDMIWRLAWNLGMLDHWTSFFLSQLGSSSMSVPMFQGTITIVETKANPKWLSSRSWHLYIHRFMLYIYI